MKQAVGVYVRDYVNMRQSDGLPHQHAEPKDTHTVCQINVNNQTTVKRVATSTSKTNDSPTVSHIHIKTTNDCHTVCHNNIKKRATVTRYIKKRTTVTQFATSTSKTNDSHAVRHIKTQKRKTITRFATSTSKNEGQL